MNADAEAKPVIVGVDGSEYSSAALRYAGTLAAPLGTRLEVILCAGMPDYLAMARLGSVSKARAAHSSCPVLLVGQEADAV